MTKPLTAKMLRTLLSEPKRLNRLATGGQCRYVLNGHRGFYGAEFFVNVVARARKEHEAGATKIEVRFRPDHAWIPFKEKM